MHNGGQQPMQPLAGPSRHGQQATHLVSGIPFNSHHSAQAQSDTHTAAGRPTDARASMQKASQNVSSIASSAPQNISSASGRMGHMSMNASQTYQNHPPQSIHAHRSSMSNGQHAPLPPVQGYATQRQITMHHILPMPTGGTSTPHPQSTMQRIPSQCIHPSMAPPPAQHSVSTSNTHAHMAHGHPSVGPPGTQMPQMGQPRHPPPAHSAPPLPSSHVQHNLVDVHRHLAQAHAQEMQQLREQAQRAPPQQSSAPAPTPVPPPSRSQLFAQQTAQQPAPPPSGPSALASASGQPPPSQAQPPNPPLDTVISAHMESIARSASAQAQLFIEPARLSVINGLSRTHQAFADELARLYKMITQRDGALRQVQAQYDVLRNELTREKALRERAERQCEELRSRKDYVEQESRNMNEHVPRMLKEYFEMRKEREELSQEILALREANSQLREKAAVTCVDNVGVLFELPEVKGLVKTEDKLLANCPTHVKTEHAPEDAGDASMDVEDYDAEFAEVLATAHEERKRKQRAERDLDVVKSILQATGLQTPVPESTSDHAPPTPAPEPEHDVPAAASEVAPASSELVTDMVTDIRADQPDMSAQPLKVEQQDNLMSWFPSFPSMSEIVDLTNILDDSPMQLTIDLPPLTRAYEGPAEPERKRSFDIGVGAGSRPSSPKRRRTMDNVGAVPESEPGLEEGELSLPSPCISEASAEEGEVTPTPAPASNAPTADLPPTPNIESASNPSDSNNISPSAPESTSPPTPGPSSKISSPVYPALSLPLPSTSDAAQLPAQQLMTPISPVMPTPFASPASPRKLSMRHIPLIYNTVNGHMSCRMCQARCDQFRDKQDVPIDKRPKPYILNDATATWDEMAGHCERVHPKAYESLINMTPDQMRVKEQQFGLCGRARK